MAIPTYSASAVYTNKPNIIIVSLSEKIFHSTDITGWVVKIDAGANVVSTLSATKDSRYLTISLSKSVELGDVVTVEYTGGGDIVSSATLDPLAIISSQTVVNNVQTIVPDADPSLVTGVYDLDGNIDISYNGTLYTSIEQTQLYTMSILRTALEIAGIRFDGDRRGKYSIIKQARDSVLASV